MTNYKNRTDNIINYDSQGWPVKKMNIRDILESLGAKLENNNWIIPESEALDIYPVLVEDDGMGYGVNEQYITEFSFHPEPDYQSSSRFCTVFREKQVDKIELWNESKFYPYANVIIKGQRYSNESKEWSSIFIKDIFKIDDEFEYDVVVETYKDIGDCKMELLNTKQYRVKESELDWN